MTEDVRRTLLGGLAGIVIVAAGGLGISALVDIPVGISAEPVGLGDRLASTTVPVNEVARAKLDAETLKARRDRTDAKRRTDAEARAEGEVVPPKPTPGAAGPGGRGSGSGGVARPRPTARGGSSDDRASSGPGSEDGGSRGSSGSSSSESGSSGNGSSGSGASGSSGSSGSHGGSSGGSGASGGSGSSGSDDHGGHGGDD